MTGTVWGVGLGPGDPELMSVRADRLIRAAGHVAYFRKAGRPGRARQIVEGMLRPDAVEVPMEYPVTTEIALEDPRYNAALAGFYTGCVSRLEALAAAGGDVVVLCEGDPFFYGSFIGAWTATDTPITWGDDVLTVLAGTLPEAELARRAADTDALVVMKLGRNLGKVTRAIDAAGRLADAWLVECATMPGEARMRLAEVGDRPVPYFSIVLVHGRGRRP